jgi:hypothetical protein
MYGAIQSVALRTSGDSHLKFLVDENVFNKSSDRVVSKVETLDGDVVVTDWGFAEGRKDFTLTVVVSVDDYETLVDFQEDNTNTFLFHYKTESYLIILRSVIKTQNVGDKIKATLRMDVVRKLNGDGVYTG